MKAWMKAWWAGMIHRKVVSQGWVVDDFGATCHYRNGRLHKMDGPAVVFPDGYRAWHINGVFKGAEHPDGSFREAKKKSGWGYLVGGVIIGLVVGAFFREISDAA